MKKIFLLLTFAVLAMGAYSQSNVIHKLDSLYTLADEGYVDAMVELGKMYSVGDGVQKDYKKGFEFFSKAAPASKEATYYLGLYYYDGISVVEDTIKIKALSLFEEALPWVKEEAAKGNPDAQRIYGDYFYHGWIVEKDYTRAVIWYNRAAEQGHAWAQVNLSFCYGQGEGVPQNVEEGVKWLRKAAEQGFAYAQYILGTCYEYGDGVTQNKSEAMKWYRKAAEQGNKRAKAALNE